MRPKGPFLEADIVTAAYGKKAGREAQPLQLLPNRDGWPARPQSLTSPEERLVKQGLYRTADGVSRDWDQRMLVDLRSSQVLSG